ncbi:MAG: hypothetical protein HOP31_06495 [Ignavibacteria bacterium]|nr:hypothetical protein [Ignavibacteria bacterium]
MDLQLKIYESDKRIRLDIQSHYKGSLNYLKFNKQQGMAIKINDNVTFFDAFYVGRGSIGGGQYLVTGVFEIDIHILREIIYSNNVEIRFSTEAGNFDFALTLATKYGFQKFYDKYITAIEENLNRE